ncbi:hypothetical protein RDI58_023420 [Solanum bulbocastanum]|uniref:F-box domain-containing protein n=1 Tax=Solanum bulbocastanum TaxID=147425 RepID=A0AAN8TCI5_SOLBU
MSHKSDINVSCDILFSIFVRLPVKSLLRFRSISISWNDIILSREFKKAHIDQSKVLGRVSFLLQSCNNDEFKFINLKNNRVIAIEDSNFPLKRFEYCHVLCSHDGLVLLQNVGVYKKFGLWNPSTRQCLKLASCPHMNISTPRGNEMCYKPQGYGLCYDPTTNDCKVILIYKLFYLVYSTRNFWTEKITLPQLSINSWSSYLYEGITVDGCVYWYKVADDYRNSTIIYFDMKSDELKELPTPNFIGDSSKKHLFRLTILKGHLSLYRLQKKNRLELNMWIMEDDGWKLVMKIPKVLPKFYKYTKILCCVENDEIIFRGPTNFHISIYNPKQRKIVVKEFMFNSKDSYLYPYPTGLDTLYFPKIMH